MTVITFVTVFVAYICTVTAYDATLLQRQQIPAYIRDALKVKDRHRPPVSHKKITFSNMTIAQIFDKIRDITAALNTHARVNGYSVDYKLRILENV